MDLSLISQAFAMAPPQNGQGQGNPIVAFLPLIIIFAIFYFLLIRPQQKRAKEHQNFLKNLKKGDEVVTNGGLIGRIVSLSDDVVTLEIAEKVRVKVLRNQIAGSVVAKK